MKIITFKIYLLFILMAIATKGNGQERKINHGVLVGILFPQETKLDITNFDKGVSRIFSIPQNVDAKTGFRLGYFFDFPITNKLRINVESNFDYNRLRYSYRETETYRETGLVYLDKTGQATLNDLVISLPIDLKFEVFEGIYFFAGIKFKQHIRLKNEWSYVSTTYMDFETMEQLAPWRIESGSETLNTEQQNLSFRFGTAVGSIKGINSIELMLDLSTRNELAFPEMRRMFLELVLKRSLNNKKRR